MKKILAFVLAFTMVFCLVAVSASADASRVIRFSTTSADGTSIADAMYLFADKVTEKSEGKIEVQIFTNGTLGDGPQALQNTQLGVQEMTMTQPSYLAANGALGFTAVSLPYAFKGLQHQVDVIDGEIGEQLLETVQPAGTRLIGIGFWSEGFRHFFTKEPVKTIEDVAGLKLRVMQNEVDTEMAKALGASPTPIAFGELYSALQTGVVDGAENPLDGIYSSKFYEVCKYITLDGHSAPPTVIIFSEVVWNTMTDEEKAVIKEAWAEVAATNFDVVNEGETHFRELLEAEGCEIFELTDREKWSEAMTDVYAKFGADCADVLEAMAAID